MPGICSQKLPHCPFPPLSLAWPSALPWSESPRDALVVRFYVLFRNGGCLVRRRKTNGGCGIVGGGGGGGAGGGGVGGVGFGWVVRCRGDQNHKFPPLSADRSDQCCRLRILSFSTVMVPAEIFSILHPSKPFLRALVLSSIVNCGDLTWQTLLFFFPWRAKESDTFSARPP